MIDMNYLKKYHSAWLPLSVQPYHLMSGFHLTALSWGTVYAIGGCLWKKLLKPCFDNLLVVVLTWLSKLLTALFFSVWLVLV